MPIVKELLRTEADGSLSFGDYSLASKTKVEDYENAGNLYKVKTFNEITKLERDGAFVYESVPGTAVTNFKVEENGVSFTVCGDKDADITLGLEEGTEYDVTVGSRNAGKMKTNLSGKLSISVELEGEGDITVKVTK
ncbi:MAG: endosialidase [Lachnospiraceae bacterium]|nr:endosialidase [Lachnospiraceae bacterium]